jgi:hypothetical protein
VNDERAADAVDHLQAAALELIEAARAFLDVIEELVGDRERLADVADVVSTATAAAARAARQGADIVRSQPGERVERIAVS